MSKIDLYNGDCLNKLKTMEDNSVDSIVTDPPYGIKFMNKDWDKGVPGVEVWEECLRVLKPGGHILAFAGTRTQHRMACNIEDAGFEIRDMLTWVYGSGFPKSQNIAKAMDKNRGNPEEVSEWLSTLGSKKKLAEICEVSPRQIDHYIGKNTPCPQMIPFDKLSKLCEFFNNFPTWLPNVAPRIGEKRGEKLHSRSGGSDFGKIPNQKSLCKTEEMFALASDEAKQWEGYGTALKPAIEPITLARKPLSERTIVANVLEHGTGGINIDASRVPHVTVGDGSNLALNSHLRETINGGNGGHVISTETERRVVVPDNKGRFPANFIHDGSEDVLSNFPETKSGTVKEKYKGEYKQEIYGKFGEAQINPETVYGDSGNASRFFYCAKPSKKEKNSYLEEGTKNTHVTVKPIKLMKYLVKLVTPENGITLDPFMGSGTTGIAAIEQGFDFIGCELEVDSFNLAQERINNAKGEIK